MDICFDSCRTCVGVGLAEGSPRQHPGIFEAGVPNEQKQVASCGQCVEESTGDWDRGVSGRRYGCNAGM